MTRFVVLALALIACRSNDEDAPAPPPPTSDCPITPNDLRAPTEEQAACITKTFESDTARAAKLMAQLDWVSWKDTYNQLDPLQVSPRAWYAIAAELDASPRAALTALQLASQTTDPVFATEVNLAIISVASRQNDDSAANTSIQRLATNDQLPGGSKLALLGLLAKRNDQKDIDLVCGEQTDASIAWRCLELATTPFAIGSVARLPTLTFQDLPRVIAARPKLPGLRCATEGAQDLDTLFERVRAQEATTNGEVLLYSRLATDAPPKSAACFLQEAATGCLTLIRHGQKCPALDAFARFLAMAPTVDREHAFDAVVEGKNVEYILLNNGSPQSRANLFHIHVVLAEMATKRTTPPRDVIRLAQYHVMRAWRFWPAITETRIKFAEMLSPSLVDFLCTDRECARSCANAFDRCVDVCKLPDDVRENICAVK